MLRAGWRLDTHGVRLHKTTRPFQPATKTNPQPKQPATKATRDHTNPQPQTDAPPTPKICFVPGVTLHLDFPFPGYPDNLGHWTEVLLPTFSVFSSPEWAGALARPGGGGGGGGSGQAAAAAGAAAGQGGAFVARVLLANLKSHLLDYFRETLAVALAPVLPPPAAADQHPSAAGPNIPAASSSSQNSLPPVVEASSLESYSKLRWILFERVAVVQDRYPLLQAPEREPWLEATRGLDGPLYSSVYKTGFPSPEAARRFREAAYARVGWPLSWRPRRRGSSSRGSSSSGGGGSACDDTADSGGAGGVCEAQAGGTDGQAAAVAAAAAAAAAERDLAAQEAEVLAVPRMVTVMLDPDSYPPITNHRELVEKLEEVAGPMGFQVGTLCNGNFKHTEPTPTKAIPNPRPQPNPTESNRPPERSARPLSPWSPRSSPTWRRWRARACWWRATGRC
jgi:hypothetical protein